MSSNGKMKNQEDSNVRVLRDLSHIPANRHCFDCGQRGPTYINATIGSFVCMTCSGLLRGLTPPHRVKSISMASFTSDEIELLKSRGNEYCRKVWLATCSAKDSHLGSDKDPDRLNLLKNFMSSKYEQKRFYVDPSKLSKTELNEIQAQTALALTSSVSQNSSTSLSSMQRSPSLSSTRSSSSQQSNPSPLMNNLRNGSGNSQQQATAHQNRLVNSITLPDIKPLSSLIGPAVPSILPNQSSVSPTITDSKSGGPMPINFINNLTSSQQQNIILKSNKHNILNVSPWASDSNGFRNNGVDNNFENSESNFADFEDAFSRNNLNNGLNNDLFAGQNHGQISNFSSNSTTGNGVSFSSGGLALNHGSIMPPPLLPFNTPATGVQIQQPIDIQSPQPTPGPTNGSEDKYAALKDLDSLFKQSGSGDTAGSNGTAPTQIGLSSSTSLPANLSSSGSPATGWFSTSSNQNPFSQAPAPATPQAVSVSGWNVGNGQNGTGGHNPFFGSENAWKSANNNLSNTGFTSPSQVYSPLSPGTLGQPPQQIFSSGLSASSGKPFNPFCAPASNPNNPFL